MTLTLEQVLAERQAIAADNQRLMAEVDAIKDTQRQLAKADTSLARAEVQLRRQAAAVAAAEKNPPAQTVGG